MQPPAGSTNTSSASSIPIDGLSPAIQACYQANTIFTSLIIAISLGAAIGIAYIFGTFLYQKFRDSHIAERQQFWTNISERITVVNKRDNLNDVINGFRLYETVLLDRRNIYWGLFLRANLALIVVGVIALLIGACKIEAQAGLPVITGIISFIIGQGADAIQGGASNVVVVSEKDSDSGSNTDTNRGPAKAATAEPSEKS